MESLATTVCCQVGMLIFSWERKSLFNSGSCLAARCVFVNSEVCLTVHDLENVPEEIRKATYIHLYLDVKVIKKF